LALSPSHLHKQPISKGYNEKPLHFGFTELHRVGNRMVEGLGREGRVAVAEAGLGYCVSKKEITRWGLTKLGAESSG
jgi:hypothetical protein